MPVTGLPSGQDRYMRSILEMDLPGNHKVKMVWVEISLHSENKFIAKAGMTHKGGTKQYDASGDTIREALLELVAEIIMRYPVDDGEQVDINIPVSYIVNTKTFNKWFNSSEKGDG